MQPCVCVCVCVCGACMPIDILQILHYYCSNAFTTACDIEQDVGGRPPRYAPAPLLPRGRRSASQFLTTNAFPGWPLQPPYALRPPWVKRPGDLDLWTFDLESGVRCHVWRANFGIPRPLCSRFRPDVRDRQTSDVRQTSDKSIECPRLLGAVA